jgi:hypothetical protein
LKIRLLDGTVKTILIDDALIIAQLMVYICTKIGIANYDEYSLVYDLQTNETDHGTKTATLRRVSFQSKAMQRCIRCLQLGSIVAEVGQENGRTEKEMSH